MRWWPSSSWRRSCAGPRLRRPPMRKPAAVGLAAVAVAAAVGVGFVANQAADRQRVRAHAAAITGGDLDRGRTAMSQQGCGACHEIPGVANATGKVGPSLA